MRWRAHEGSTSSDLTPADRFEVCFSDRAQIFLARLIRAITAAISSLIAVIKTVTMAMSNAVLA
jgi:hypothetical protein